MISSKLSESQSETISFRPQYPLAMKEKTIEKPAVIDPAAQLRMLKDQKREKRARLKILEEEIAIHEKHF